MIIAEVATAASFFISTFEQKSLAMFNIFKKKEESVNNTPVKI
jgi:hypothetical protein